MADPIINNGIRAQFILPGRSGLPEDRYVTTWAFRTLSGQPPTDAQLNTAAGLLAAFWVGQTAPGNAPLHSFLSPAVDKSKAEARVYRLGQAPPRQPLIVPFQLGAISQSDPLPSEVALVCSFFGQRNLPSQRGRVYLGPFSTQANSVQTEDLGVSRPVITLRTSAWTSMKRLEALSRPEGLAWSVLSQKNLNLVDVTQGWVDNAWDTQRRRGEAATGRITWLRDAPLP